MYRVELKGAWAAIPDGRNPPLGFLMYRVELKGLPLWGQDAMAVPCS
jgi:hypothetical protein